MPSFKEILVVSLLAVLMMGLMKLLQLPDRAAIPVILAFFLGLVWKIFFDGEMAKERDEDVPK